MVLSRMVSIYLLAHRGTGSNHSTHIVLSRMVHISWSTEGPDTIKRLGKGEFILLELKCLFFLPSHICTFDFEGFRGGGRQGLSDSNQDLKYHWLPVSQAMDWDFRLL